MERPTGMSVFDSSPRWATVRRILTAPAHQYVSLRDVDPTEGTPTIGRRLGVRTSANISVDSDMLSPRSDEASWGGADFASYSSPLIQIHKERVFRFDGDRSSQFPDGGSVRSVDKEVSTPVRSALPTPSSECSFTPHSRAEDAASLDGGGTSRDLAAMLRFRLKPWSEYVAAQRLLLLKTIPSYEFALGLPAEATEEHRISRDVGRTFAVFEYGSDFDVTGMHTGLQKVLSAVVKICRAGYCQGMNFMAALILTQTDEESAFWLCLRLQLHHNMQCLYSHEHPFLTEYLKLFYLYCQQYVPALMQHFKEQQYFVTMFAVEWFTTLFAPCISGATCSCVLDLLLAGCDNVLFRFGAAILVLLETHLIVMSTEELMMNFKQLVRGVDHTTLALTALSFPDTPDVLMTWLVRGFTILTEDGKHHVKHGFIYVPRSVNIADVEFAALGVEGDEPDSMTSESTPKPMLVPVLETPASPPPCCDRPHLRMKLARSSQATTHTMYQLLVETPDGLSKVIWTRYSELLSLFDAIFGELTPVESAPAFPGKKWFGVMDPSFVEQRRCDINAFMQQIVCELALPVEDTTAFQNFINH